MMTDPFKGCLPSPRLLFRSYCIFICSSSRVTSGQPAPARKLPRYCGTAPSGRDHQDPCSEGQLDGELRQAYEKLTEDCQIKPTPPGTLHLFGSEQEW
jgi:hypothetical protein